MNMGMDIRGIKDQLGRIKPYYLKNEMVRALGCAVLGLKGVVQLGTAPSTELRGLIREGVQLLVRDEAVKTRLKAPLVYQPGQERQILAQLAAVYKALVEEAGREDWEAAFKRKQKLDQSLNLGLRLLAQGNVSEADAAFAEAVTYCKDEFRLYGIIGKALVDAGEVRRAAPYIKKGQEALPQDAELAALHEAVLRAKSAGTVSGQPS